METGGGAAVKIPPVAIVALFTRLQEVIAAIGCTCDDGRLQTARGITSITRLPVAVIALFKCFLETIAANGLSGRLFPATQGIASVSDHAVAVIAFLSRFEDIVAADELAGSVAGAGTPGILDATETITAVAVRGITIVALFRSLDTAVAAACQRILTHAGGSAAIAGNAVAVIAFLRNFHASVATLLDDDILALAEAVAAISVRQVAVITIFAAGENTIAAEGRSGRA